MINDWMGCRLGPRGILRVVVKTTVPKTLPRIEGLGDRIQLT